jgi:hypothetical protein
MLKSIGPQFIARGVRVRQQAPWISHLLFADDCLIFTQAYRRGADTISEILELYYKGSGQLVNKNKSAVFFSGNCVLSAKQEVHEVLQIPTEALGEKYLCLPTAVGIKANAQAVPTYPMSCFLLLAPTCKQIKKYISNYWRGSSIDNHRIHRQRWSKLTRTKAEGGLGFRDLPLFNQSMLGKQGGG